MKRILSIEEKKRIEKGLEKWNANSKHYVSIEAIEDVINWLPDLSQENKDDIYLSPAIVDLDKSVKG